MSSTFFCVQRGGGLARQLTCESNVEVGQPATEFGGGVCGAEDRGGDGDGVGSGGEDGGGCGQSDSRGGYEDRVGAGLLTEALHAFGADGGFGGLFGGCGKDG